MYSSHVKSLSASLGTTLFVNCNFRKTSNQFYSINSWFGFERSPWLWTIGNSYSPKGYQVLTPAAACARVLLSPFVLQVFEEILLWCLRAHVSIPELLVIAHRIHLHWIVSLRWCIAYRIVVLLIINRTLAVRSLSETDSQLKRACYCRQKKLDTRFVSAITQVSKVQEHIAAIGGGVVSRVPPTYFV